jgi:Ca-activated chloride channel family protein
MSSLEFQNAGLWYLWLLLPIVFWLHAFARREVLKDLSGLFGSQVKGRMWQGRLPGSRTNGWLCSIATALVVFALMRPSWGYKVVDYEKSVAEIVIALDVSDSMMAADISPSRYERARRKVLDFVKRAQGERLALVAFSGTASVESPLTEDPSAFLAKLSEIDPSLLPVSGSRVDLALYRSLEVLGYGRKSKAVSVEESSRPSQSVETGATEGTKRDSNEILPTSTAQAILLITDGESDSESIKNAMQRVSKAGVRVFVLGVGTTAGAPVPDQAKGTGFRKDSRGALVTSRLDSDTLKMIANEGKGVYVDSVSDDGDLMQIYDQGIKAALTDSKGAYAQQRVAQEMFQVPLALAFVLLLIAIWRSWGRRSVAARSLVVVLLGLFAAVWNGSATADDFLNRRDALARRAYQAEDFGGAVAAWKERLAERGSAADAADYYNLGNALYRAGDMAAAAEAFKQAADKAAQQKQSPERVADILHNLGNSHLRQGRPKEAIDSYEKSLSLRPRDKDTLQNLSYARKVLTQQEQQEQQRQQEQKQNRENAQDAKQSSDVNQTQQADKEQAQSKDPAAQQQDNGQASGDKSAQSAGDGAKDKPSEESGKSSSGEGQKPGDTAQNGSGTEQSGSGTEQSGTGTEQSGSGTEQSGTGESQSGSASGLSRDEVEKALNKIADDATVFRKRRGAKDAQQQIEQYGGNPKGGPEW